MNFFDSYWEAAASIGSKTGRREFIAAVVEYYYTGEKPEIKSAQARVAFAAVRYSVERAINGRRNRVSHGRDVAAVPSGKDGRSRTEQAGASKSCREARPAARPHFGRPSRRGDFRFIGRRKASCSEHAATCVAAIDAALGTDTDPDGLPPGSIEALDETRRAYGPADVGGMASMVRDMALDAGDDPPSPAEILDPGRFYDLMEAALLAGFVDDGCGREDVMRV